MIEYSGDRPPLTTRGEYSLLADEVADATGIYSAVIDRAIDEARPHMATGLSDAEARSFLRGNGHSLPHMPLPNDPDTLVAETEQYLHNKPQRDVAKTNYDLFMAAMPIDYSKPMPSENDAQMLSREVLTSRMEAWLFREPYTGDNPDIDGNI